MDKKSVLKNLLVTFVYAVFTLIVVLHHEIWADEAQVWLICKHLNVIELFKHLVNEGHPAFFYLLIMPFAKIFHGINAIFSMQLICWLSSCIAIFLLWQFSPFNKWTKVAITLSGGFLYYFPVIARSYSILPLLIFGLAIIYKKKRENPFLYASLLAMIATTHVMMFCFVFILGVYWLFDIVKECPRKIRDKEQRDVNEFFDWRLEKVSIRWLRRAGSVYDTRLEKIYNKKNIISVGIIFTSLIYVVLQLVGTTQSNGIIGHNTIGYLNSFVRVVIQFFTNSIDYSSAIQLANNVMPEHVLFYFIASALFLILFLYLVFALLFLNKKIFLLCFLSIGFQIFTYILAYSSMIYPTRSFVAFSIMIFSYWILFDKSENINENKVLSIKVLNIIIMAYFAMTFFNGLNFASKDLAYNYSSAKETAEFINKNIDKNSILIPSEDAFGLGIYYYLPEYKFYSMYKNREIEYMIWYKDNIFENTDKDKRVVIFDDILVKYIENKKIDNEKIYIIKSNFFDVMGILEFEEVYPDKYKKIFKSKPSLATGEGFSIYEYRR